MIYTINWTLSGESSFKQNLDYLNEDWDDAVINQFLDRVSNVLDKISKNPFLYPLYKSSENIRRCIINGRIILYYRIIEPATIDILLFWSTMQSPDKLYL